MQSKYIANYKIPLHDNDMTYLCFSVILPEVVRMMKTRTTNICTDSKMSKWLNVNHYERLNGQYLPRTPLTTSM